MPAPYEHIPVLYEPVLEALGVHPGGAYVDATVGLGGHAAGILERSAPDGRLLGLDVDPQAIDLARQRLSPYGPRAVLLHADYTTLAEQSRQHGFGRSQGVLFDLGASSLQLDRSERGFSFQADAPLDMRFDPTAGASAADLLESASEEELADILWRYGEERLSRRIARRIVQARREQPIERTGELARLVTEVSGGRRTNIHPATRTFMALRIAVNRELQRLPTGLEQAVEILAPEGRLVVLSFHSLEDRLAKRFVQDQSGRCDWPAPAPAQACPHYRPAGVEPHPCQAMAPGSCARPVRLRALARLRRPTAAEVAANPRARSAILRVAERVGTG